MENGLTEKEIIQKQFRNFAQKVLIPKNIDTGCFGGIHQKYWVDINKQQYMFKYSSSKSDYSDFGEVFVSYLSYVLGYKCIDAMFCKDFFCENEEFYKQNNTLHKIYGTLIKSYRTKNVVETLSLCSLLKRYGKRHTASGVTTWETAYICEEFCAENNIVYPQKLEQELKEMALLDYLFVQVDRGVYNIEFLIEEKRGKKYLKLAPMFDNGFCLHLMDNYAINNLLEDLKSHKSGVGLTSMNPKPDFYIEKTENIVNSDGSCIVPDLATELIENKALLKLYENFKQLNIKDEVEFVASLYSRELPQIKKEIVCESIKNRIYMLDLELSKQRIKNNFKEYKDECDFKL